MTTLKTKQEFMLGMETTLLRLCAGERCINEAHVCARINRREATTYSHGEIRRGLERLLDKCLVQKLNVTGDVWRFLNEKIIEVKPPPPKQRLETESKQFMKFEPKKKNQWTSLTEQIVLGLIKEELNNIQIIQYLKENHDFEITAKRLAWRIVLMRKAGLLKQTPRNRTKVQWTHEEILDLVRLREAGNQFSIIASIMTEAWGREFTYCSVTAKYQEYLRYKRQEKNNISFVENLQKDPSIHVEMGAKSAGLRGATNTPTSPNRLDKIGVTWLRT
jgi:hypothetical protein